MVDPCRKEVMDRNIDDRHVGYTILHVPVLRRKEKGIQELGEDRFHLPSKVALEFLIYLARPTHIRDIHRVGKWFSRCSSNELRSLSLFVHGENSLLNLGG